MNPRFVRLLRFSRRAICAGTLLATAPGTVLSRLRVRARAGEAGPAVEQVSRESTEDERRRLLTGQQASDAIRVRLESPQPCLVARLGHTEAKAMVRHDAQLSRTAIANTWTYLSGKQDAFWWDESIRWEMQFSSGFFPTTDAMLERFCTRYRTDLRDVDVLGSWLSQEACFSRELERAERVPLQDLEPFWHADPWSAALEGRRVLVVHPFAETIRKQYARRKGIFADRRVLPDFDLRIVPAVQTLGGATGGFADWFAALDHMCRRMEEEPFDVALIGAGAYGLPLGAHAKRLGRKAVHLGGALQLLFGIRGARWEQRPQFAALMNDHWARPSLAETPHGHHHVDQGISYW